MSAAQVQRVVHGGGDVMGSAQQVEGEREPVERRRRIGQVDSAKPDQLGMLRGSPGGRRTMPRGQVCSWDVSWHDVLRPASGYPGWHALAGLCLTVRGGIPGTATIPADQPGGGWGRREASPGSARTGVRQPHRHPHLVGSARRSTERGLKTRHPRRDASRRLHGLQSEILRHWTWQILRIAAVEIDVRTKSGCPGGTRQRTFLRTRPWHCDEL